MSITPTRTMRLLVTAIGAAVVEISVAAAPVAVAEKSGPNDGNHIPITPGDLYPQPGPLHILIPKTQPWHILPSNKPQGGGWK